MGWYGVQRLRGWIRPPLVFGHLSRIIGRGAFHTGRRWIVRSAGLYGSDDAGMSSDKMSEKLIHRKPKVS